MTFIRYSRRVEPGSSSLQSSLSYLINAIFFTCTKVEHVRAQEAMSTSWSVGR